MIWLSKSAFQTALTAFGFLLCVLYNLPSERIVWIRRERESAVNCSSHKQQVWHCEDKAPVKPTEPLRKAFGGSHILQSWKCEESYSVCKKGSCLMSSIATRRETMKISSVEYSLICWLQQQEWVYECPVSIQSLQEHPQGKHQNVPNHPSFARNLSGAVP